MKSQSSELATMLMRGHLRALLVGVGLIGCSGGKPGGGEDSACVSSSGHLEGVVYENYPWTCTDSGGELPLAGYARVKISRPDVDQFTAVADAEGHYEVELAEGVWDLFATDTGGGCVSQMDLSVEIVACEALEFDFYLTDCLSDR